LVFGFLAARFLYVFVLIGQAVIAMGASGGSDWTRSVAEALHQSVLIWLPNSSGPSAAAAATSGASAPGVPGPALLFGMSVMNGWSMGLIAIIGATTLVAAALESLPIGLDDTLLVPLAAGGFLFSLTLFDPVVWAANRAAVLSNLPWAIGINGALAVAAYAA